MKSSRKRRAKKLLFKRQGGKCYYCGVQTINWNPRLAVNKPTLATLDHIVPLAHGGAFSPRENCVLACFRCNNERGTMDADAFRRKKQATANA